MYYSPSEERAATLYPISTSERSPTRFGSKPKGQLVPTCRIAAKLQEQIAGQRVENPNVSCMPGNYGRKELRKKVRLDVLETQLCAGLFEIDTLGQITHLGKLQLAFDRSRGRLFQALSCGIAEARSFRVPGIAPQSLFRNFGSCFEVSCLKGHSTRSNEVRGGV